jgi:membrane associated rhomboid family serine protease
MSGVTWRNVPATVGLVGANIVVAALIALSYGSTGDMGALVRAGANVKSAVGVGEWWRLPSSVFVHVGLLHLALNMFGLWVLGKLVEQMFGSARFFAIYMVSGIGGALASYYVGGPGMSMGASGAVLGIMGAAVAELGYYRKSYPKRWRNGLFGMLVFITVAQIAIGFAYPAIDQAAHVGGFLCGAVVALALSRKLSASSTSGVRVLAGMVILLSALSIVYAAHGVATTDYGDTLRKHQRVEHIIDGLRVRAPANFILEDGELVDPSPFFALVIGRDKGDLGESLAAMIRSEEDRADDRELKDSRRAVQNALALPEPWQSRELVVSYDGIGGAQHFRVAVFGRVSGDELWLGRMLLPNALSAEVSPVMAEILESVESVRPSGQ